MSSHKVPTIFDQERRRARQSRAFNLQSEGEAASFLSDDMIDDVVDRLEFMRLAAGRTLVSGLNSDKLIDRLSKLGLDAEARDMDEEQPYPGAQFDCIFSMATLDTVNDLPGALFHVRNALTDGGLFIGQLIGAGSLPSLRQIMLAADGDRPAARIHPQVDNRAGSALLERAGFKRHVVDTRTVRASYRSMDRLIADLREQAMTSVLLSRAPYVGKAGLARARDAFEALKDDEGRVTETFEILTLTGWR